MTIFINGKQVRVPRPPLTSGLDVDDFIARNADPIWLHQNELWEVLAERSREDASFSAQEETWNLTNPRGGDQ